MSVAPDLRPSHDRAAFRRRRGFWLRIARERARLSQAQVARALGMSSASKSTLSAWEVGRREPSLRIVVTLARIYDVPASSLLDPEPTAAERLDEMAAARREPRGRPSGRSAERHQPATRIGPAAVG